METGVVTQEKSVSVPLTAKSLFDRDDVKNKFKEMMGKKAQGFVTSVLQVVASNGLLAKADPVSVYNSACMAAVLDLPINPNLGFAYIIPYNEKFQDDKGQWATRQVAQFQLGYKGFIQLAQRSGQFKTISATPIFEGQLVESNPLTGFKFDFTKKTSETVIGFAGYFELLNGFEKTLYMTVDEMKAHGLKYSKTYNNKNGRWTLDFLGMGNKTVLKLLLSKFAPLSIEMQKAVMVDQAIVNDDKGDSVTYADHEDVTLVPVDKEYERIKLMISDCKSIEDLEMLQASYPDMDVELFELKKLELTPKKK